MEKARAHFMTKGQIIIGNSLDSLNKIGTNSVQSCVTSPPYWNLRDYKNEKQLGQEATPEEYVQNLCAILDQVHRVLKDDGTLWLNIGDTYQKNKNLAGIPFKVAFELQRRGWILRQDIIWNKPNPMPESVTDRCTRSHEYIFLLTKNAKYYFDADAIKEPLAESSIGRLNQDIENQIGTTRANGGAKTNGNFKAVGDIENGRNKRSVWTITTKPYKEAHFATYPPDLIEPCILAGSKIGDTILDPFSGSGTTGQVAMVNGRNYIGMELNPEYVKISEKRIVEAIGMMGEVEVIQ
jgi:DNA modification methylase